MRYLLFCLCPLLVFGNTNEDEALFLNRIADFWEEGEYEIAKHQIQEFLTLYPKNSSSDSLISAIADLHLREKNYSLALESYSKITDPIVVARIFPHKLQCLYALKKYEELANESESFLQHSPDDLQIIYYLAISLYQQCLSSHDKGLLIERALPSFAKLFSSPLKTQVAAPYAHLLCMEKEFSKAADIYLELETDESLFQAALIQAEYDKELALQTFDRIKNSQPDSAFNCLVLSFDLQKYDEIIEQRDTILSSIPKARIPMAHLFFGRSFLAKQKYLEACEELEHYISTQETTSDTLHAALLTLLESAIHTHDDQLIENSLTKIASFYPEDEAIVKGKISKAAILREKNELERARNELESLPKTTPVLLEQIYLCNQMNDWVNARECALLALEQDPSNALVKKYFLNASTALANRSAEGKRQLIDDLKKLSDPTLTYFLAKTYFNLHEYQDALPLFLTCQSNEDDLNLMIALCYRDGFHDLQNFCEYAEKVPSNGAIHSALYNAYLTLSNNEKAAYHLYLAYQTNMPISSQNLSWLSEQLINQGNREGAINVLESMEEKTPNAVLALSKLYHQANRNEDAVFLLESIKDLDEAALLLGEIYVSQGKFLEAQTLFAKISQEPSSLKTYSGASACLQNMRLQMLNENFQIESILSSYRNMMNQKNLANEPLYLEAALDYVALQTQNHGNDPTKKLALLRKMKRDFEHSEDLLSKDYHTARLQRPEQDAIYHSYMNFLDAEMLRAESTFANSEEEQKELQAKANVLLLKVVEEKSHPALVERANQCLNP